MSALKWQGWLVGLMGLAALLVFAPLGLYVWASGGGAGAPAPGPAAPEVRVAECRIDPVSRRVVAVVEARGEGSYVVTVEFRDRELPGPNTRTSQSLIRIPGLTPDPAARAEALGPVWPPATTPWCGIASTTPAPDATTAAPTTP
ncbi:hypothetical protein ACIRP0_02310 [Streptomyces sp. NPDC101733]|uniref:hypothetical protein n=1 Tax=unclassified Streptomyces TaxID=2593676 RepID=UPI00381E2074